MNVPELLRASRQERGLTQAQLARRAGTTQSYIGRIERGEVSPSVQTIQRLLYAMGRRLTLGVESLPHGNPTTAELRAAYEGMTATERIRHAIELSEYATRIAESTAGGRRT